MLIKRCFQLRVILCAVLICACGLPAHAADKDTAISKFFQSIAPKMQDPEAILHLDLLETSEENVLPEGEILFLTVRLPRRLRLEGVIFAQSRNNDVVLSLKDFIQVTFFPIDVDIEARTAQGWYIRENKIFNLDLNAGQVVTDQGTFQLSDNVFIEGEEIFVPIQELAEWIDFEMKLRIAGQELFITPSQLLPLQEKLERKAKNHVARKAPEAELPVADFPKQLIDLPVIDVIANISRDKDGESGEADNSFDSSITSRGDFAYGTLTTRSLYNDEEGLTSVQATYKQESEKADLLGSLKARRYELGDVTTTNLPLASGVVQDLGFRVTNRDPLKTLTSPTSVISGTTFPDWDVELYRDNQFLAFQSVDENGFFSFNNVDLFGQDNNFRLVFYGPQGEIREEAVSIPVDTGRLSDRVGVYDVSLTLKDEQAFINNNVLEDEDSGSWQLSGLYEQPLGKSSAISLGVSSEQSQGERNYVSQAGLSTLIDGTLVNINAAIDDELETNAELALRRSFGPHDVSSTTSWIAGGFDFTGSDQETEASVFRENLSVVGPFPFLSDFNSRYFTTVNFQETSDGDTNLTTNLGLNARWEGLTFNEQLSYVSADALEDDQLSLLSTISGTLGKNRIRAIADYDLKPESELSSVLFSLVHDVSNDLDIRAELDKTFDPDLTEGSVSVDWKAGFARLSPRFEYNSDNDVFLGLTTRFSALREPLTGDFQTIDRAVSGNGGFSAFVYLDENGNLEFDEETEQPMEGVVVQAIQNGGIETTNEDGIAVFTNMIELKRTDVVVEERSLEDPLWIPATQGVGVVPREGFYAQAEFPVHTAGEIDGTVLGFDGDQDIPMKNVGVELYGLQGDLVRTAVTDLGGFYFFSRVPPGTYYLSISPKSAQAKEFARPLPQKVEIGYDGTLLFGQDIKVRLNEADVPSRFLSDLKAFQARHPHVGFDRLNHALILNLGEYNSQMHMALVWFKLRKEFPFLVNKTDLYVTPEASFADPQTGKHILRAGFKGANLEDAYRLCRSLIAAGRVCEVEILPQATDTLAANDSSAKAG